MNAPQTALPADHPVMKAWAEYKASEAFANSMGWAMQISPMVQAGDPDGDAKRRFDLMPREQREAHVRGALWSAFVAGFEARSLSARANVDEARRQAYHRDVGAPCPGKEST